MEQLTNSLSEVKLGVFSSSMNFAQSVSKELRLFQKIIPTFPSINTVVEKLNTSEVDMLFIDFETYQMMSRIVNGHPKVKSKEVLIILCKEANQSLADSDLDLNECGQSIYQIINLDNDFTFQVQSLLSWLTHHKLSKNLERSRLREMNIIRDKYDEAWGELRNTESKSSQFKYLYEMILKLRSKEIFSLENLIDELSKGLSNWRSVNSFSYYFLSLSQRNLISRPITCSKQVELPSIELGETCKAGISGFHQEQAYQVVFEEMGIETIALRIEGLHKSPDLICFINLKKEVFDSINQDEFSWDMVENSLSHIYRGLLIQDDSTEETASFIPIWDVLSLMDDQSSRDLGYKFFNIDLLSFNRFISKNQHTKFRWNDFFRDVLVELSQKLSSESKISTFGSSHIVIMIPSISIDSEFQKLKKIIDDVSFWKYFSDSKLVMPSYVYPRVNLVPRSSSFYISKILFGDGSKEEVVRIHENSFPTKRL